MTSYFKFLVDVGLLKSSQGVDGEFLPLDASTQAQDDLCNDFGGCFMAGDSRANEQTALTAFHALFLREHNRIARILKTINPYWNGETIYQQTRAILGAVMQKITYDDFLPKIIGPNVLPKYKKYRPKVNPGISNAFATAAFRFGHSLVPQSFDILNNNFDPIGKSIDLRFIFFNNTFIQKNGINPLLLGLIANSSEVVDRILSRGLTDNLFERQNSPGSNLAALNIQRSRDHGLPGYNRFRKFCGLKIAKTIDDTANEITSLKNRNILKHLYNDNPDLIELWVAGLAEAPMSGASVGPTFQCIIKDQFQRVRDGDRFFHEKKREWAKNQLSEIKKASLSRIYCDNLDVVSIQRDAFLVPTNSNTRISCGRIPGIDLCKWKGKCSFMF